MMIDVLQPSSNHKIIDPACGSGGFLAYALRYLIMSRPRTISSYEHMQQIKKWTPSDPTFGY